MAKYTEYIIIINHLFKFSYYKELLKKGLYGY